MREVDLTKIELKEGNDDESEGRRKDEANSAGASEITRRQAGGRQVAGNSPTAPSK